MMGGVRQRLFGTLRAKLVFGVAAVHTVMMLVFVVDQAWKQREVFLDQCEDDARGHVSSLASVAAGGLLLEDVSALQEAVDSQASAPVVIFAMVTDPNGVVLAHTDRSKRGMRVTDMPSRKEEAVLVRSPALVDVVKAVHLQDRHIGWVRVGVGLDRAEEKFRNVVLGGVIYTTVAALVGILVAWLTASHLTARLNRIQKTINRVRDGDSRARTRLHGADEAAAISAEFDLMLDGLLDRDERLRRSESRFRTLFDESAAAIWVEDASDLKKRLDELRATGVRDFRAYFDEHPEELPHLASLIRIIDINRRTVEMLKAESVDAINRDLRRHFNADSLMVFKEELLALIDGKTRFQSPATVLDAHGNPIDVEMAMIVQPGFEDTYGCVQISFIDITERRRAEAAQALLSAQLQQAQKMESVGRLAGGVAHDFNNMLTVILGQSEMALHQIDAEHPVHAELVEIRKAAERSVNLVRQLLAFARKQTVTPKVLNLNDVVEGMSKMLMRLIGEDISLKLHLEGGLWSVKIDPVQIDQILVNLCVNSRDAMPDGGVITIATRNIVLDKADCAAIAGSTPGDYVLLTVTDDGCGMDAGTLANIFEPFFTTKAPGKGTGLGLSTVYGIARQNGGFVSVASEPRSGSTFSIYLPCCEAPVPVHEAPPADKAGSRAAATILVVEDEPAILSLIVKMLELQGYTVYGAASPVEALRITKEHVNELDLLITDVVMPEMNGRDLADLLVAMAPRLRRLFMSGHTADIISRNGEIDAGMHFIQKPFSVAALCAKVREVLDAPVA